MAEEQPERLPTDQQRACPVFGQALADNLGKNVMAEHLDDLNRLPPKIRAAKTEAEWLETPSLEILRLARNNQGSGEADARSKQRHMQAARRIYVKFVLWWMGIALAGCIIGAAHDGARSVVPNFLLYGLGGAAALALILSVAYFADSRLLRQKN